MNITAGIVCCNDMPIVKESIDNLLADKIKVIVCDNGSSDGTKQILGGYKGKIERIMMPGNRGISRARNEILSRFKDTYLLTLDGDMVYVKGSARLMADTLSKLPNEVYALNVWIPNGVPFKDAATTVATSIGRLRTEIQCNVSYGMTRADMASIPYPIVGPFGLPGWGFEDDYRHAQAEAKGRFVVNCTGFKYYHAGGSSKRLLDPTVLASRKAARMALLKHDFPGFRQWEERLVAKYGKNFWGPIMRNVKLGVGDYKCPS